MQVNLIDRHVAIKPLPFNLQGSCVHEYDGFMVISLTQEQHNNTCGYWYVVKTHAMAHTAFATRINLLRWLALRHLKLEGELAEAGTHSVVTVSGKYRTSSHLSYDAFYSLEGDRIRHLDNGDYTLGIITDDEDGIRTVHHLNPNLHARPVFDYFESRAMVG